MKNKKFTYLLGLLVAIVWGIIIYRIFDAANGSGGDTTPVAFNNLKKEPYNDFAVARDTIHLLLNYRDPFGLIKQKDTTAPATKKIYHTTGPAIARVQAPSVNWAFIQYSGYIRNPVSKKLITLVSINGKNETLAEGQVKDQVKLLKNLHDSIKISYNGKIKFIAIRPATL